MKIQLADISAWKWLNDGGVYVCGFAFCGEHLLHTEELLAQGKTIACAEEAIRFVEQLNGSYAMILRLKDKCFLAVDHVRSIPLFYAQEEDGICVFDSTTLYHGERTFSEHCASEFLATGYVTGKETLFREITQMEAGQWITISGNRIIGSGFHHTYEYQEPLADSDEVLLEKIDCTYRKMTERLIKVLDNRTAIIPLSGGHDSRLLAYYLCEAGYRNIITYTYGRENNGEAVSSKKVAEYLNLPWYFVPYKTKELAEMYNDPEVYAAMADRCGNSFTVPLIQEWKAVDYLTKNHIIDEHCVIVPGYSNDMLNGSHLRDVHQKIEQLEQRIVKGHYCLWGWNKTRRAKELNDLFCGRVRQLNALTKAERGMKSETVFQYEKNERFDYYERQVKHIVNAVRMYDLYGLKWVLPFWDCDLIRFWLSLPLEKRERRSLFLKFTAEKYPELMERAPVYSSGYTQVKERLPKNKLLMKVAYAVKFLLVALTGRKKDKLNYYGYMPIREYWSGILKYKTVNYYHMFARHYVNYLRKKYRFP